MAHFWAGAVSRGIQGMRMFNGSMMLIETKGFVNMLALVDLMVKEADVELIGWKEIGSGFVSALIWGDVASLKCAVEVASSQAESRKLPFSHCLMPKVRRRMVDFLMRVYISPETSSSASGTSIGEG